MAFKLVFIDCKSLEHRFVAKDIIDIFIKKLLEDNKDDRINYDTKHDFLVKFSNYILRLDKNEIQSYLKPFLEGFNTLEIYSELFNQIIYAEDGLNRYENFWYIWHLFYDKIVQCNSEQKGKWYYDKIIRSYLFADVLWQENIGQWHSFKGSEGKFFKNISKNLGHSPITLYSISMLLYNIGSIYINEGIYWVAQILEDNPQLEDEKLEINTIYYLESISRKYCFKNREQVRETISLKKKILIILDFLIKKGSVAGYLLRENIL